jgi:KipI family sensor histidine kinase inhibitor
VTGPAVVRPFGDTAVLADVGDGEAAVRLWRRLDAELRSGAWPGVEDVVVGFGAVTVTVADPTSVSLDALTAALSSAAAELGDPGTGPGPAPDDRGVLDVPVRFDGPDLGEVAGQAAMSEAEVVEALAEAELRVGFVGFAPGFGYLVGLPPPLAAVSRRPRPRPAVPAGSVAVGGGFAGVYPQETPGGWQLVGRTDAVLFDDTAPPYAVLEPGRRVRLRPTSTEPAPLPVRRRRRLAGEGPALEVLEPGPCTLIEDAGRVGVAALGVPRAGTADDLARWLANRLVGNDDGDAVIEVTGRGPRLLARADLHVAAVADPWRGGAVALSVDGRPVPAAGLLPLRRGQVLEVGSVGGAVRATVAVGGGLRVPAVLGSRSSDLLCGLGPGPLQGGDVVPVGPARRPRGVLHLPFPTAGAPALRVLPGPDVAPWPPGDDTAAAAAMVAGEWRVATDSNRVGIRLVRPGAARPPGAASALRLPSVPSRGMVTGAVQVPSADEAIVLGPDHATVGGYPVAAVVIAADRHRLAHLAPGSVLRLEVVDPAQARSAWRALTGAAGRAVHGWFPTRAG